MTTSVLCQDYGGKHGGRPVHKACSLGTVSPLLLLRICFDCAFRVLSLCQFDITDSGEYPLPPLQDPEVNVIKNMELAETIAV